MLGKRKTRTYGGKANSGSTYRAPKRNRSLSTVPRWATLRSGANYAVQPTLRAKLIYSEYYTVNPGAGGAAGTYIFSANGLYDPNITGVGHQPTGFDQIMAIWGEYVVVGSTIKTYFRCPESQQPALVGIAVRRDTSTSVDMRQYIENGEIEYTKCEGYDAGGQSIAMVKYKCDMRQAKTNVLTDPDFFGTAAANPPEQRYYHIIIQAYDATSDLQTWQMWTEIEYDVIFRDRITTNLS